MTRWLLLELARCTALYVEFVKSGQYDLANAQDARAFAFRMAYLESKRLDEAR